MTNESSMPNNADQPNRWIETAIRFRFLLLLIVLILLILGWPIARNLKFDQSIESLFAPRDSHLLDYLESKQLFGGDEFVIFAYIDEELMKDETHISNKSAQKIRQLVNQLGDIPGVNKQSTQNLVDALKFPFRLGRVKKLVKSILVGDDDKTTAIVLRLIPEQESPIKRAETIQQIRDLAKLQKVKVYVAGEPVQVHDMFRFVEEDGKTLFVVSLSLLGLVIFIMFRNLRWVALPLLVVVAAIICTEAILVLFNTKLSMVSSMLNSLVTIIGIATVTHFTVHFREKRARLPRQEAFAQTFRELLPPVFWTSLTTAVGFLALMSSEITPIRSFSLMMSLATILVLVATFAILPGGILAGRYLPDPGIAPYEKHLIRFLEQLSGWIFLHAKGLIFGFVAIVVVAVFGLFRLQVETDFSKNFRKSSSIVQSLDFIEERLGGAGSWEINFPAPSSEEALTEEYLDRVRKLATELREQLGTDDDASLTKVTVFTDAYDIPPKIFLYNTTQKRLAVLKENQPEFVSNLWNVEQGRMRIVLRAFERQPAAEKLELIESVERIAREEFPQAKATGLFVLLAYLIDNLLRDQLVSFAIAGIGIGLMMTIALRNFRIGLISLIPNIFPIVVLVGGMGWLGITINIATAMIASVSLGLTIDFSIHYLFAYQRSRRKGVSVTQAIEETSRHVGRALVFSNIALIVGFSVLTLSHFVPLIYFGILVSIAMLGGLVGNLVLLPLLLQRIDHDENG